MILGDIKPTIRQSTIQSGLKCRRAFQLAHTHESEPSKAMIDGLVFEAFVLPGKEDALTKYAYKKEQEIKKTFQKHYEIAQTIKPMFGEGSAFERLYADRTSHYLTCEPDFVGTFKRPGHEPHRAIVDLKFCADIPKIWNWKQTKEDYFQAVSNTLIVFKATGELLPFYYLVVDHHFNGQPIFRVIPVKVTGQDFLWFCDVERTLVNDELLLPDTSQCLGKGRFDPPCRYLYDCDHGRDMVGGEEEIVFSDLQCEFEPDEAPVIVNEQVRFDEAMKKEVKKVEEVVAELDDDRLDDFLAGKPKRNAVVTVLESELSDGPALCRNCRTRVIEIDHKNCPNCDYKIVMMRGE